MNTQKKMTGDPLKLATDFEALAHESKEIAAESKELKAALTQFFETHPEVQQIGNVKCTRAPKKTPMNPKAMCEIVEDEIMKAPPTSGAQLVENIVKRIRNVPEGDMQIKIAVVGKKNKSAKMSG